jgi:outer membrane protein
MRRTLLATLALGLGLSAPVAAQPPSGDRPTLTLEEALTLARRNNPTFQLQLNNRQREGAALRTAYGTLLPSVDASLGSSYREGRQQVFGGLAFGANSDVITSQYSFRVGANYSLASILAPRQQAFSVDAADADVSVSDLSLRQQVVERYLLAQQTARRAELQDSIVARQRLQLELAEARAAVGSATQLDVKRAEVSLGQQQIQAASLQAAAENELMRLLQLLAVPYTGPVALTSAVPVTAPETDLAALLTEAKARNPTLAALRSRESVATVNQRRSTGQYLPTLSVSAGFGGFTNQFTDNSFAIGQAQSQVLGQRASCFSTDSLRVGAGLSSIADRCSNLVFTDADADRIRRNNSSWPFDFSREPYVLSASLSVPLFNGFQREQAVQEARISRTDAQLRLRDAELELTTNISVLHRTLRFQWDALALRQRAAEAAEEALTLAQEQYRVGTASYIDVATALNDFQQAQADQIIAIYDYQRSRTLLEQAIGRSLR